MSETLQEKATRLTIPDRALIWVAKAGPLCAVTARGAPVCLRGAGLSPSPALFVPAVVSAVPGMLPALRGGRPLRLPCFFIEVGSPGFWLGVCAPSLGEGLEGGRPLRGGEAAGVSEGV